MSDGADNTLTASATGAESRLGGAVELGWRVAELYALVDDLDPPVSDTLLPGHRGLAEDDQLELQVRAAAGDARRIGFPQTADAFGALINPARGASESPEQTEKFRLALRDRHVELQKELWASQEALGKAYELGIGLSDTYGRVSRAYRTGPEESVRREWINVFSLSRIEQLKKLIADLQSRLDPAGATVVSDHLDRWRERVVARFADQDAGSPNPDEVRRALRGQTIIWRQLLAGDKRPDAYLDRHQRAEVQGELKRLVWRSYGRWLPAVAATAIAALTLALANFNELSSLYEANVAATGLGTAVVGLLGALGITRASVILTVRTRAQQWSELLWNRVLVKKISDVTLTVDDLFPVDHSRRAAEVVSALRQRATATRPLAQRVRLRRV